MILETSVPVSATITIFVSVMWRRIIDNNQCSYYSGNPAEKCEEEYQEY